MGKNVTRKGEGRSVQSDIRRALRPVIRAMHEAAEAVGGPVGSIAGAAAAASTSHMEVDKKDSHTHTTYVGQGPSFSRFLHVRSFRIPRQIQGMAKQHYWMDTKGSVVTANKIQNAADVVTLWDVQTLRNILNTAQLFPNDIGVNVPQNTLKYFMRSCRTKTLFSNVTSNMAHCQVYDIRARDTASIGTTPLDSWAKGLNDIFSTDAVVHYQRWGTHPNMSRLFKEGFEILNTEAFSLAPGQEHLHIFDVKLHKNFTVEDLKIPDTDHDPAETTAGTLGGWSHHVLLVVFGQLNTEDNSSSEVALGVARVNWLTSLQFEYQIATSTDQSTAAAAATAQDTLTTPKRMAIYTEAEQDPAQP